MDYITIEEPRPKKSTRPPSPVRARNPGQVVTSGFFRLLRIPFMGTCSYLPTSSANLAPPMILTIQPTASEPDTPTSPNPDPNKAASLFFCVDAVDEELDVAKDNGQPHVINAPDGRAIRFGTRSQGCVPGKDGGERRGLLDQNQKRQIAILNSVQISLNLVVFIVSKVGGVRGALYDRVAVGM